MNDREIADPDPSESGIAGDSRDRLIDAGWETIDGLPLAKVFAGATSAQVAARAGLTTGSYFHHFSNGAEFADAMVLRYREAEIDSSETMEGLIEALEHIDLIELMRTALTDTWQLFAQNEEMCAKFRGQLLLSAHHEAVLSTPTDGSTSVGDVLRQGYRVREGTGTGEWSEILERTGRVILEPFTMRRIGVALTALFEGLRLRAEIEPEAVDDEIFGDIAAALASTTTGPTGGRPYFSGTGVQIVRDEELSPQARSGARRRRESRQRIVAAATGMFDDGWESVTATDVAERADVANQTILNLFRGVRGVAAATFGRHIAEIRRIATASLDDEPVGALRDTLTALAERAAHDRGPARALLSERLDVAVRRGGSLADMDVRVEVPLAESVMLSVARMDLYGADPLEVVTMLINFVLGESIVRPGSVTEVADLATRLLPSA